MPSTNRADFNDKNVLRKLAAAGLSSDQIRGLAKFKSQIQSDDRAMKARSSNMRNAAKRRLSQKHQPKSSGYTEDRNRRKAILASGSALDTKRNALQDMGLSDSHIHNLLMAMIDNRRKTRASS